MKVLSLNSVRLLLCFVFLSSSLFSQKTTKRGTINVVKKGKKSLVISDVDRATTTEYLRIEDKDTSRYDIRNHIAGTYKADSIEITLFNRKVEEFEYTNSNSVSIKFKGDTDKIDCNALFSGQPALRTFNFLEHGFSGASHTGRMKLYKDNLETKYINYIFWVKRDLSGKRKVFELQDPNTGRYLSYTYKVF